MSLFIRRFGENDIGCANIRVSTPKGYGVTTGRFREYGDIIEVQIDYGEKLWIRQFLIEKTQVAKPKYNPKLYIFMYGKPYKNGYNE